MLLFRVKQVFKAQGIGGVVKAGLRRLSTPTAKCFSTCRDVVTQGRGLEIGGPSLIFQSGGLLPVYSLAERIDNCNFAAKTIFGGDAGDSSTATVAFNVARQPGTQFIAEGSDLGVVGSESYDFVLSSHMLEHSANPLRALKEWRRVLRADGGLVLILPHKDGTFDHRRPVTAMEHLVTDFDSNVGEDDLTHIAEVLEKHDVKRDYGLNDTAEFYDRVKRNPQIRSVHHHVFDMQLAARSVSRSGFKLLAVEALRPYHIIVVARKSDENGLSDAELSAFLTEALRASPFSTDRLGGGEVASRAHGPC